MWTQKQQGVMKLFTSTHFLQISKQKIVVFVHKTCKKKLNIELYNNWDVDIKSATHTLLKRKYNTTLER